MPILHDKGACYIHTQALLADKTAADLMPVALLPLNHKHETYLALPGMA
jgi:hypothetical protein